MYATYVKVKITTNIKHIHCVSTDIHPPLTVAQAPVCDGRRSAEAEDDAPAHAHYAAGAAAHPGGCPRGAAGRAAVLPAVQAHLPLLASGALPLRGAQEHEEVSAALLQDLPVVLPRTHDV